jgi:glycosyltransferase involved in cell wall biosynthesis
MDALHGGDRAGGTEGQLLQLLTHLDPERYEPHLALFRSTQYIEEVESFPCPVEVLHIGKLLHPRSATKLLALRALVRRRQFPLVHVFLNDASIAAPFFCRIAGARVIASRRDMGFWYTPTNLRALRVSNRFVERMIANSEAVRRNVHQHEGYPEGRIEVVYNGHDADRFEAPAAEGFRRRFNIGPTDPIIGMVANFNPWKRHVDLLHAFARVRQRHPNAHLVFVGTGAMEPSVAAARTLGLGSAVHFIGGIANPVTIVKHFSVGVLCSESEGFSNAVIEYMGSGKPTVCTNVGGNPELIDDGETGFLVSPFDVPLLADRIGYLLDAPAAADAIGQQARLVAQRLTSRRMAEAHMALYDRVASTAAGVPIVAVNAVIGLLAIW